MYRVGITTSLILWLSGCGPKPQGEIVLSEPVPLYETPSGSARILDTLRAGSPVALLGQKADWTWVCVRGLHGWINLATTSLPGEPLPESILAEKRPDSLLADIGLDNDKNTYLPLTAFQPWFVQDSLQYAGFYEGLPGEPFALLIVNFAPRLSLILRATELNPETMEMSEDEHGLFGDYYLLGNLLLPNDPTAELPFKRAEFIFYRGKRGVLIEKEPGTYKILWRREIFS